MSRDLDDRELERVQRMRSAVLEQMPEVVPSIRDLAAAGLITGWRNVVYVGPPRIDPGAIIADAWARHSLEGHK